MTTPILRFAAPALALALALGGAPAKANPLIVADVSNGVVLEANEATVPWYPASLTKLMTTLVVLNAVKAGKLTPQTPILYTARAQLEPPSKMGFQVGQTVTVDDALKMLMVQSANDIAYALAEGVSGSADAFVEDMNRTARQIGMTNTNFVNPNGLPVKPGPDLQHTTARDLAVLAVTLLRTYPEQAGLFGIDAIKIGDRILRNHNGLIGRYPGADGMKTGYTCSAGYNVVATATRGGRHLVAVVRGAPSPLERSETAIDAFERDFPKTTAQTTLAAMQNATGAFAVDLREKMCSKAAVKARIAKKIDPNGHPWRQILMSKTPVSPIVVSATPAPGEPAVAARPSGVNEDSPTAYAPAQGVAPGIAGQNVKPGSAKVRALKAAKSKTKGKAARRSSKGSKTAASQQKTGKVKIDLKPALNASAANGAQPSSGSIYRNAAPAEGKSAF